VVVEREGVVVDGDRIKEEDGGKRNGGKKSKRQEKRIDGKAGKQRG